MTELSVVIPTFGRGAVILETIRYLRGLTVPPHEIIIADQTPGHPAAVESDLAELDRSGAIRWLRLEQPSIPRAMNRGLLAARHGIVLFLDDDIIPGEDLVSAHLQAQAEPGVCVVAGRVLQPWDRDDEPERDDGVFRFSSTRACRIEDFMGGNFSVQRETALRLGGFDENFVRVAHWFEREFADRLKLAGIPVCYEPAASLRHLKAEAGGIRSYGQWRRTFRPGYSVGSYYYLLRSPRVRFRAAAILLRPFRVVATRHHLRNPWWIPPTLIAELLAFWWAVTLTLKGPRLLNHPRTGAAT